MKEIQKVYFTMIFGWFGAARAKFWTIFIKKKLRICDFFHWGNLPDRPGLARAGKNIENNL